MKRAAEATDAKLDAAIAELGAPGKGIVSTLPGGYGYGSGTSMAAPHVAGDAALFLSLSPYTSHQQLKARLLDSSDVVPALQGKVASGGRLNLYRLLTDPNECTAGTHDCGENATCLDTPDGFSCTCQPGFEGDG